MISILVIPYSHLISLPRHPHLVGQKKKVLLVCRADDQAELINKDGERLQIKLSVCRYVQPTNADAVMAVGRSKDMRHKYGFNRYRVAHIGVLM